MNTELLHQQYLDGDKQALDTLLAKARKIALSLARRFNVADPDEVAQQVVIRAWQNLASYDPKRATFSTWVGSMARNMAMDSHRSARDHDDIETAPLPEQGTTTRLMRVDISHLSNTDRRTLAVFATDQNFESTAATLGITVAALKKRLHRIARKRDN